MNRCKDCKFFEPIERPDAHQEGWGDCVCQKIRSGENKGYVGDEYVWLGDPAADNAWAECDEYRGFLRVGPDFGCIHWTEK